MVTLEQIETLLDRKLQGEREHTKKAIEAATQGYEKRIMQGVKQVVKEEITASLEPIKKQLNELAEMDKQILIEVGEHHHKLENRVDRIEKHLHFPPLAE